MTEFDTEYVPCCVCHATGKIPRLLFFTKDCVVCRGKGERPIIMARNLADADKAMVRQSAIYGSYNFAPSPLETVLGQALGRLF